MRGSFGLLLLVGLGGIPDLANAQPGGKPARPGYTIAIHGGAGVLANKDYPRRAAAHRKVLLAALRAGQAILERRGQAMDAVQAAIRVMEDSPLFNAGRGSVYTHDQTIEMDASLMDGRSGKAGAVAGVRTIRNPINAARAVMDRSPHVLLSGRGAERFAKQRKLRLEPAAYFRTKRRLEQLRKVKQRAGGKHGTVGAAVRDVHGNLAAGTSTGGMTNKRWGRIGDSPIIGAGTYAKNATVAVSCTGHGEYFIRQAAAHSVSMRMELARQTLPQATRAVIFEQVGRAGGKGGLIAVDRAGNVAASFNTGGMFRAWVKQGGKPVVKIW